MTTFSTPQSPNEADDRDELIRVAERRRRAGTWAALASALVAAAVVAFVVQNTASLAMEFLWWDFEAPVWVAFAIVYVAGALTAVAVGAIGGARRRRRHEEREVIERERARA